LEKLTLINNKPQNHKRYRKSKNNNENLSIIEYPHLTHLNLDEAHDDYVEQFLFDTKICLSNDLALYINYQQLKRVTHNFKRNATRINCSKIIYSYGDYILRVPTHFKDYFLDTIKISL